MRCESETSTGKLCRICNKPLRPGEFVLCRREECVEEQNRIRVNGEIEQRLEERKRVIEAKKDRLDRLFDGAGLVRMYRDTLFDDLLIDDGNEKPIVAALDFARDFGRRGNKTRLLWLFGKTGRGKTMLAHAVANALIERGKSLAYVSVREGVAKLFANYRDDTETRRAAKSRMRAIERAEVVLVDDLGYEGDPPPDWFNRFIHALIERQYGKPGRGLIITSELTPEDIKPKEELFDEQGRHGRYGPGTASMIGRMRQMGGYAHRMASESWRDESARAETARPFRDWANERVEAE